MAFTFLYKSNAAIGQKDRELQTCFRDYSRGLSEPYGTASKFTSREDKRQHRREWTYSQVLKDVYAIC